MPRLTKDALAKIKEKVNNIQVPNNQLQHVMELQKLITNAKTIISNNDKIFNTFSDQLAIPGGDKSNLEQDARKLFENHKAVDKAITITLYSYVKKYLDVAKERGYDNYLTKEVLYDLANENDSYRFLVDYQMDQIKNLDDEDVEIEAEDNFDDYLKGIEYELESGSKRLYKDSINLNVRSINKVFPNLDEKFNEWKNYEVSPKLEGKKINNLEDCYSDIKNTCNDSNASYYDTIQAELKSRDNDVLETKAFRDNALTNSFKNDKNYYISLKNKEEALLGSYAFIMEKRNSRTWGDVFKHPIDSIKDFFLSKSISSQLSNLNYKQTDLDNLYNSFEEKKNAIPVQEGKEVKSSSNSKEKTNELRNDLEKKTSSPELSSQEKSTQIVNDPNKEMGKNNIEINTNKN